jgi:NAD(P)-dependent dehydrogenase (short-subunit alcohol dehydrogenase family)
VGDSFGGKNILVTGASRGIGRAIALKFAELGARVAVHYHQNREAAEETLARLPGGSHLLVQADVSSPGSVEKMVDTVAREMGRIHVLVNNAGTYPIIDLTYEEWQGMWERTVRTNLMGPANTSFCVAQHMKENGGGKIVNISSRGAFRGEPDAPAYGASKAGLNALSQSMAQALALSSSTWLHLVLWRRRCPLRYFPAPREMPFEAKVLLGGSPRLRRWHERLYF